MPSVQDIMLLCRLCSVKDKVTVPIFGEDDANDIPLKISACLPVKVSLEDNLPKKICDTCLNKLESLYQFWNEAANTERKFLDWLSQDELIADDDSPDAESSEFDSMTIKREEELIDVPDVNFSDVKSLSADPIAITKQIEDLESTNSYEPPFKRSKTDDNVVPIQRAEDNKDISSLVITSTIDIDSETKTEKESENALDQSELQNFVPVDEELQPGTSGIVQPVNEETSNCKPAQEQQLKKSIVVLGDLGEVDIKKYQFVNNILDELKLTSLSEFRCHKCDEEFHSSVAYIDHLIVERCCKFCSSTFDDVEDLKNHVQTRHPYTCEECRWSFVSGNQLRLHAKLHTPEAKKKKNQVGKPQKQQKKSSHLTAEVDAKVLEIIEEIRTKFENSYQLQRHCAVKHKKKPRKRYDMVAKYKCVLCSKHYFSERLLEEHKKIHLVEVKSVAISNKSNKESEIDNSDLDNVEDLELRISDTEDQNLEPEPIEIDDNISEAETIKISDEELENQQRNDEASFSNVGILDEVDIICNDIEFSSDYETVETQSIQNLPVQNIPMQSSPGILHTNQTVPSGFLIANPTNCLPVQNIPMQSSPVTLNTNQTVPSGSLITNPTDSDKFRSMRVILLKDKEAVSEFLSSFPSEPIKPASRLQIQSKVDSNSLDVEQKLNNINKMSSSESVDVIEIDTSGEESETDETRELCALCSKSHRLQFLTNRSNIYVCIWCSYILCLASNKLRFFNRLKNPVVSGVLTFVKPTETTECNMCKLKQSKKQFTVRHSLAICNTCKAKISQLTSMMMSIGRKKGKQNDGHLETSMVKCEACNIAKKLDSVALLDDIVVCNWCWPKLIIAANILSSLYYKTVDEAAGNSDVSKTQCHLCNVFKKADNISLHRGKSICIECKTNINKLAAFFSNVLRNMEVCDSCTKIQRSYILKENSIFCSRCVLRRPNACAKCDAAGRLGKCICETKQPTR